MKDYFIFLLILCLIILLFAELRLVSISRPDGKEIEPVTPIKVNAITMPENCYDQLKNADMIHIKIIKEDL